MLDALFLWVSQIPTRGVTYESAETRVITRIPPPSTYGMGTKFRISQTEVSLDANWKIVMLPLGAQENEEDQHASFVLDCSLHGPA